jgi:peptidyl-prolyl cis-trans isomerase C
MAQTRRNPGREAVSRGSAREPVRHQMDFRRMMSLRRLSGACALAALVAAFAVPAAAKTVAKVDGVEISDGDVAAAADELGPMAAQAGSEQQIVDYVIDTKLVSKAARDAKLDQDADVKRKIALQTDRLMMEALLTKVGKDAVTEEAMKKVYDDAAKANKPADEVKARHILVPTEEEAKKVVERLKKGEDFAKLAAEVSKDPGSKDGDLGWFTAERMVPEFSKAAFGLEKGKTSEPIKTQFGWHVIEVQDKRQRSFPAYDTVKDQIEKYVMQKAQADYIMKLRASAKIEKMDAPKPDAAKPDAAKPDAAKSGDATKPAAPKN